MPAMMILGELKMALYKIYLKKALLYHKDYSDKTLLNAILLQLYGTKFTIEPHNL